LVLVAACGASTTAPVSSLASCFVGDFFADCGGSGAPVLACRDDVSDCRWFTGGVIASGYDASTCSSTNICCVDRWPFSDGAHESPLNQDVYHHGTQPWDRTRAMTVPVTIDPSLPAGTGMFACTGSPPNSFQPSPCRDVNTAGFYRGGHPGTVWMIVGDTTSGAGWYPHIEIDPTTSMARICTNYMNDAISAGCPFSESYYYCAQSGTLTLSKLPASDDDFTDLHGRYSVDFGPFQLTASF
jgi:hypothetical protein